MQRVLAFISLDDTLFDKTENELCYQEIHNKAHIMIQNTHHHVGGGEAKPSSHRYRPQIRQETWRHTHQGVIERIILIHLIHLRLHR